MIILLVFSTIIQVSPISAESNQVTVSSESLNVRSGPGLSYDVIDHLTHGKKLDVLSSSEEWLKVKYEGRIGWVASWLTSYTNDETSRIHTEIISQTDGLNFRSSPSIDAPILSRMSAGERASLLNRNGEWLHVQLNGTKGWVYAEYTSEVRDKQATEVPSQQTESKEEDKPAQITDDETNQAYEKFTVGVDTLNVRRNADQSSKKIGTVHKNETYPIQQTNGNWIQIKINDKKSGWVYSFHGNLSRPQATEKETSNENPTSTNSTGEKVTILSNGTNIRKSASTSSEIVKRADAGEQFPIVTAHGDWYEVDLADGTTAFIANWVVSENDHTTTQKKKTARVPGTLNGLTIVVDPGHGGNDRGTTGTKGTFEKTITLKTAELLASKLKAAGATVHLTRETDRYIPLQNRVWTGLQHDADAFISLHYDANPDSSIKGFTTYYQHANQAALAKAIDHSLGTTISLKNRGTHQADYYVLRENKENAVLIELGFLSNATEEMAVNNHHFREQATYGIYTGILNYFNTNN